MFLNQFLKINTYIISQLEPLTNRINVTNYNIRGVNNYFVFMQKEPYVDMQYFGSFDKMYYPYYGKKAQVSVL